MFWVWIFKLTFALSSSLQEQDVASPVVLDRIESKILASETLSERITFVDQYLKTASAMKPRYTASPQENLLCSIFIKEAAKNDVELKLYVGKYNLLLCPPKIGSLLVERGDLYFLDLSYILLKQLFGFSPAEAKHQRILHRYAFDVPSAARSKWAKLICEYGVSNWKEWSGPQHEWQGNPIHEMTHCFAGPSPGKLFIESLPNSGEGWPKWTPHYIYRHFPNEKILQKAVAGYRREYVDALKSNFRDHGKQFWKIDAYNPCGGLLVLLADAVEVPTHADPFKPFRQTFTWVNQRPDPGIPDIAPLGFIRFVAHLERFGNADFWKVLETYNCPVTAKDTANYRIWEMEILPVILEMRREPKLEHKEKVEKGIDKLDLKAPYGQLLEEQARANLKQALETPPR